MSQIKKKTLIAIAIAIVLALLGLVWVSPYFSKPKAEDFELQVESGLEEEAIIHQYQTEDGMWIVDFEIPLTNKCKEIEYDFLKREWNCVSSFEAPVQE